MNETTFTLGKLTLAGLENAGSGEVIIGLHGFLDNAASLSPLAPYLKGHRFIALDLPGHGKSSHRSDDAHYHQLDFVQDLYALIKSQGVTSVILLGHSLGGILATLFAAVFPELVKGVISLDACGPLTKSAQSSASQIRDSVLSRYNKKRSKPRIVDLDVAVKSRCQLTDIQPEHAKLILQRNLMTDDEGNSFWASDPKLRTRSSLRLTDDQAEALMRSISCPILFVAASSSFKKVADVFNERAAWFSQGHCQVFQGGHHIHMEQTDAVGTAIRQFVEQM
ncbi:alpha/beta hydrolase [Alteromonas sp. C1M14]|uniref:alpha/beta fold hydrolase n=1 Tax=Alteromonas sp. C1M14 TaxID=2841567 RepID=UPI001C08F2C7|nr:alpha/beta hydrolase [Alteromonas sp. C1M14]MBU2979769.1 alpha/beta hydrolase [Alteromonas sp. C1M14]